VKIYNTLALDYLYETPSRNTIFVNNHDMSRTATALKEDPKKIKQALGILLTQRGAPQLYYGEEWFMTGDGKHHPLVRRDFPGGWAGDSADFFTGRNAGAANQDMFNYYQKLLQWRKTATAIHNGKLTQFVPDSNVYVYFRHTPTNQVMVVVNGNKKEKTIKLDRYAERLKGTKAGMDIVSGAQLDLNKELKLEAQGIMIIDLPYKIQ
jgi:glycosidase